MLVKAWSKCRFEKERKTSVHVVSKIPAEIFQCMWRRANYEAESVVGLYERAWLQMTISLFV
jgi:hypothetical protein